VSTKNRNEPARPLCRKLLLSTSALTLLTGFAFSTGEALAGPDACVTLGSTVTCQGNQSAGITSVGGTDFASPPVDTLNVNSLTQDIVPIGGVAGAGGVPGILFLNNDSLGININVNTGAFQLKQA